MPSETELDKLETVKSSRQRTGKDGPSVMPQKPCRVMGVAQHYSWGAIGEAALIPRLLGEAPGHRPWAEFWLGTHPKAPTKTVEGVSLSELFSESEIPWLLKILDAGQMLSVQVHPTKAQAEAGFAAEMAALFGSKQADIKQVETTEIDLSQRNYNDPNPKPEIAIPLTEMWLMAGFLDQAEMVARCKRFEVLHEYFGPILNALEYTETPGELTLLRQRFYEQIYALTDDQVAAVCEALIAQVSGKQYQKNQIEYWMLVAHEKHPHDVGMLSFFTLNLVHLSPSGAKALPIKTGDAVHLPPGHGFFTPAGIPHFYLQGACIEHMANSDNVLRAGFTDKHKDIETLLRIVDYAVCDPTRQAVTPISAAFAAGVMVDHYKCAENPYFETTVVSFEEAFTAAEHSAQQKPKIGFVLSGQVSIEWSEGDSVVFQAGEAFLIPAHDSARSYRVAALVAGSQYVLAQTPSAV